MAETKYIIVGDVVRPHGIKGELCIDSYADSPSYFTRGATVRLAPPNALHKGRNYVVAAVREHKGRLLLTFNGVSDRNMHSPFIEKVEVVSQGKVRRSRLYYLRALRGKAARIKTRTTWES